MSEQPKLIHDYFYNLIYANVISDKQGIGGISYNGSLSPEEFRARLMMGEMAFTASLCHMLQQWSKKTENHQVIASRIARLKTLWTYTPEGWQHQNLCIIRDGRCASASRLPEEWKEIIRVYSNLQHESFENQVQFFIASVPANTKQIFGSLLPTELIECAIFFQSSEKLRSPQGELHRTDLVRWMANTFNQPFPSNYETLVNQLLKRENITKFIDETRQKMLRSVRTWKNCHK